MLYIRGVCFAESDRESPSVGVAEMITYSASEGLPKLTL